MRFGKKLLGVAVVVLVGLGLILVAGCGGADDEPQAGAATTAQAPERDDVGGSRDGEGGGDAERKADPSGDSDTDGGGKARNRSAAQAANGGKGREPLPADMRADATPKDPEVIKRMIPQVQVTPEGRVQTMDPDPARHESAQKNTYGSVREFGEETAPVEATQVTFALVDYLNALVRSDWARACDRLYGPLRESFEKGADGKQIECAKSFGEILGRRSTKAHRRAMLLDVSSVRIGEYEGDTRAFVIYKTPETLSADMPLYLEDGVWKVAAIEAYTLRPEQVG